MGGGPCESCGKCREKKDLYSWPASVLAEYIELRYGAPAQATLEGIAARQCGGAKATPFEEDCEVLAITERLGLELSRYTDVEITDMSVIKENGLMRESPDYGKIRRLLEAGEIVQGARIVGVQYSLRPNREAGSVSPKQVEYPLELHL